VDISKEENQMLSLIPYTISLHIRRKLMLDTNVFLGDVRYKCNQALLGI